MLIKHTLPKLTFKKNEKLKSKKVIQSIFLQNQTIKIYPFKLVWIIEPNNSSEIKMGTSTAKRLFKLAVTRNLIKRRMRECLRLNKTILTNALNNKNIKLSFMLLYIGKEVVPYNEFNIKIKQILIRLTNKI